MFKKTVTATQLTSQEANYYFDGKVYGSNYSGDVSFLASLRALVAPRMGEGDRLALSFGQTNYSAEYLGNYEADRMVASICSYFPNENGVVYVHDLRNRNSADNVANIELMKKRFCQVYSGWEYLEDITRFFRSSFHVACFINREKKSAVLFVDRMTVQKLHLLGIAILAFMPWYFDPSKGVSEVEKKLLCSLRPGSASYEDYIAAINEIAAQYDFESARLKRMLGGFEARFVQKEKASVEKQIRDTDRYIADYYNRIGEYNTQRAQLSLKLLGIETKLAEGGESEILDYFQSNKALYLVSANGDTLEFIASGHMQYWDEDMAKRYLKNRNSYFYEWTGGNISKEQMKKLMWDVFVDQRIKIRFCSAYTIQLANRVRGQSGYYYDERYDTFLPNPHIRHHSCMGNYETKVNKLIGQGDYVMAIEQCIASAKSLNIGDSTVMRKFIRSVVGSADSERKFFELPDGQLTDGKGAVAWMEQQEADAKAKAEAEAKAKQEAEAAAKAAAESEAAAETPAEAVTAADEAIIDEVIAETTQADVADLPF